MKKHPILGFCKFGVVIGAFTLLGCGGDNSTSLLEGRIFTDSNENGLLDNGESPMSGIEVTMTYQGDDDAPDGEPRVPLVATTDENGVYRFEIDELGSYSISQELERGTRNISNNSQYSDSGDLPDFGPSVQAIVGGQNASPGEYPFMTGLVRTFRDSFFPICGSALISDKYVLTAAHCVVGQEPGDFQVSTGGLRANTGTLHEVSAILVHPEYNPRLFFEGYDIALVELAERIDLEAGDVFTLETAKQSNSDLLEAGGLATVIGWGSVSEGVASSLDIPLQEAHFPFVSNNECRRTYSTLGQNELVICAGTAQGGVDSCQGDSGGPLMVWDGEESQWLHAGVVSGGLGCARPGVPGVYTRTSGYQDWLGDIIDETSSPSISITFVGGDGARVDFANKFTMRSFIGESEERANP